MINFDNTAFVKSCVDKIDDYKEDLQEVLFIGRSNVGKSSLINLLTNKNRLAFVSSKPGHTRLLNYYLVDTKFFLVDAPGYGYSAIDKKFYLEYEKMMDKYFDNNKNLKLVVLLIDSRRGIGDYEQDLFDYFNYKQVKFAIVFTKTDKTNQSDRAKLKNEVKKYVNDIDTNAIFYSRNDRANSLDLFKGFLTNYLNFENN